MSSLIYGGIVLGTGYKFVYGSNGLSDKIIDIYFSGMNTDWFNGFWAIFIMTFACTSNHIMFLTNAVRSVDYHTIGGCKKYGS